MFTVVAPALITASTMRQRKSISLRVASSADHSTSSIWLRARVTLAIESSITCSGQVEDQAPLAGDGRDAIDRGFKILLVDDQFLVVVLRDHAAIVRKRAIDQL